MESGQTGKILPRILLLSAMAMLLLLAVWHKMPCLFRSLTGVPCPTCGMSRAWLAVLRLDLAAAFRWHPVFWGIPVLGLLYILEGFRFPGERCTRFLYLLVIAAFGATHIIRMVLFFGGALTI